MSSRRLSFYFKRIYPIAEVVVVIDIRAREHKAVHPEPVNEHLSQLYTFLTHLLIVKNSVWTYNIEVLYFSLNQQIAALGIDPKFIALHDYLLIVRFGELLLKSKWVQGECVVK